MTTTSPVIVALDYASMADVEQLIEGLEPGQCRLKVGKELFTYCGPAVVEMLQKRGFEVFLDLKFHDIPNTVAGAVRAAAELGVWMVNVHASGGRRMMEAAREALSGYADRPHLIAVTVLTSMDHMDLQELGIVTTPMEQVVRLARLGQQCGLDGVVCSAQETKKLRASLGADFQLVTPGIRPDDGVSGDQRRVATPASAVASGSDYLVIGRPITRSKDPAAVVAAINSELGR